MEWNVMNPNIVSLAERRDSLRSVGSQRAQALFGPAPMFTFQPDGADADLCCSVRLLPAGDVWVGLLDDKAAFTDRVRMAGGELKPQFVVHVDGDTPTVCGEAAVQLLGRVSPDGTPPEGIGPELERAALEVIRSAAFGAAGRVLVAVRPDAVRVDEGEDPAHGAVPRT